LAGISEEDREFFERRVRPVLVESCHECHSAASGKQKGGLSLDHGSHLRKAGILDGETPEQSLLLRAIRRELPGTEMPPDAPLAEASVEVLAEWVRRGAPWPDEPVPEGAGSAEIFDLEQRRRSHWSWQVPQATRPPAPVHPESARNEIDAFLQQRLQAAGLRPAAEASRHDLIRRLSFDLTGLPPTPEEIQRFLGDSSPEAWENLVDRTLASPHFGEHWARHWMDLARYAGSYGHEFDFEIYRSWQYRDYLIRAFNADLPYHRFVAEQIAGDLLDPRYDEAGTNQALIATGFLWLGEQTHSPVDLRLHQAEQIDNRIDVLTKSFQALTVSCARCHDHKFDAISAADYYSLYQIFDSTRPARSAANRPEDLRRTDAEFTAAAEAWRRSLLPADLSSLGLPEESPPVASATPSPAALREHERSLLDPHHAEEWTAAGEAFRTPLVTPGTFLPAAGRFAHAPGLGSAGQAATHQGHLWSPDFEVDQRWVHVLVDGEKSRIRLILHGLQMVRDPLYGTLARPIQTDGQPRWISFDLSKWAGRGHHAYLEFLDLEASDPGSGLGPHRDDEHPRDGWLVVHQVLVSPHPAPPPPEAQAPASAAALAAMLQQAADPQGPDMRWLWVNHRLAAGTWPLADPEATRLAREASLAAAARVPRPALALTASEGPRRPGWIFRRGNPHLPEGIVPPRYLEALGGSDATPFTRGTGRLELAEAITAPENPYTDRVLVNRLWHHLFGMGLVPSVDNFGVLGEIPSHPELLDWLAITFRQTDRGSVKSAIRRIVLSHAYRQSTRAADPRANELDPRNALLARRSVRRLPAESLRDALLASAASLDPTAFGPPVPPHLTPQMDGRGRPRQSGPLDGARRRSIYLDVRRNFLHPFLLAFDQPIPFSSFGRRNQTNIPAQALALMNDPFVHLQASRLAERALAREESGRLAWAYLQTLGRPPHPGEITAATAFLGPQPDLQAWTDFCHALFNHKDFLFLH
jgi:hypothetical protein